MECLISYGLRCDTCQSSLPWWALFSSAIPCCSSATPINSSTQDSLAGPASPRATLRQVPRFPSAPQTCSPPLSLTRRPSPELQLALNRSIRMLGNTPQLKGTTLCLALSWPPARTLTRLRRLSPWRPHCQHSQAVCTMDKGMVL